MAYINSSELLSDNPEYGGIVLRMYYTTTETATSITINVTSLQIYATNENPPSGYSSGEAWYGFAWEFYPGSDGIQIKLTGATTQTNKVKSSVSTRAAGKHTTYGWTFNKAHTWQKTKTAQSQSITGQFVMLNYSQDFGEVNLSGGSTSWFESNSVSVTLPVTVPAIESWEVALDDGTAQTTLTKWYNEALALPQPSRDGYAFRGWALASDPTTVVYQPGAPYTANAAASLVAVIEPLITSAVITQLYAARDDGRFLWDSQTGKHTSASDDGEYVYIRAWWRVEGAATATVTLGATMTNESSTTVWTGTSQQVSKPGTGETYLEGVAEWGTTQTALVTGQYDVTVTLSTGAGNPSDTRGTTVSTAFFTIDVLAGGHGIAFGKPATQQIFDVGMDANFGGGLTLNGTPILELVYPVGAIYMSTVSTSPAVLFGGTWERMTQRFLLGADDNGTSGPNQQSTAKVTAGSTGGQAGVTLTVDQIPSHTHDITYAQYNRNTGSSTTSALQYTGSTKTTEATGGGQSHNNMPPFEAVYMWKRTA